ncbi:hypothetical protein GH740_09590 [Microbacterium sp. SYP-A9085]|uniref:hypothetical protein n=1 Tax=Microbacterium sp. SYP-A9085 TaxID=2664454 RepID=UPI00129B75FA|nr:hypothetical protein [Microbacterium sp. SYP-A9085]MRH29564.1 hypothetical protein [Microbacterium sp. SYP-A9085]
MSHTTRARIAATTALSAGVLSLIATTVLQWSVQPAGANPTPADVAAQFPAVWSVMGLLAVFGPVLWLAAVPAMRMPGRGGVLTAVGAGVTGLGLAAGIAHLALFFGLFGTIAAAGVGEADAARLGAGSDADLLTGVLLYVFLVAFAVGPILLTLGLRISRIVAVWVPVAALVTAVASMLGGPIAGAVQLIALAATWAPVAVAILRGARSLPAAVAVGATTTA